MLCRHSLLLVALCLPLYVGCGGNPLDRQNVSGRVTFDSQPLDQGSIQFSPASGQGGIFTGALIADGKYDIPRDKGLPPGKYTVRISAADPKSRVSQPSGSAPGSSPPPLKELLPERFNSRTELSVEVKSNVKNTFDFDLTK